MERRRRGTTISWWARATSGGMTAKMIAAPFTSGARQHSHAARSSTTTTRTAHKPKQLVGGQVLAGGHRPGQAHCLVHPLHQRLRRRHSAFWQQGGWVELLQHLSHSVLEHGEGGEAIRVGCFLAVAANTHRASWSTMHTGKRITTDATVVQK